MASSGSFLTSSEKNLHLRFSWEIASQSIENNTTTISWKLSGYRTDGAYGYVTCGGFKVKINGVVVLAKPTDYRVDVRNGDVVASGTAVIPHTADGTKTFTAYAEAGIYWSAINCSGTADFTLDTIPRASSLTAANGTLDVEQTLTIDRATDTFKHRLLYKCGDVADYIDGSATDYTTATSIKWTPPIGLAHENTTGTSVSITLTLYTYTSDGTHVGTVSKHITCAIPTSVKPSVTIAWEDTTGAADTYGAPVQGISKLKITLEEKTSYSSPISVRNITANGVTYATNPATTGVLASSGSQKIAATVKDKRGRTGSNSATLDVLAYNAPVVSKVVVHRCDEDGTENDQGDCIEVRFSAAVTALGNKNSARYKIRYKAGTETGYTEVELTDLGYAVTDYSYVFEADGSSSYDVEVVATDNHGTATRATSASTAFTLMNWHPSGTGMGIGKVSENENALEVGLDADFRGPVYGKAYGLGILPSIPEYSDINSYITPGIWAVRTNAIAETLDNLPVPSAGRLIVAAALGQEDHNSKWRYIERRFIPHNRGNGGARTWIQYVTSAGTDDWVYSPWIAEALEAYPVGSIHLRYDNQNPADLFGGTWTQITARVLRAGSAGSIGAEGSIADGSGRTYIDIAVWRRTA